jgi:hypothetical protein
MKTELIFAISTLALSMMTGCVAMPVDDVDGDDSSAETEAVGEAAQAIDDDPGGGGVHKTVTLSCSINWAEIFKPRAAIKNTSGFFVPGHADILYTVTHEYGSPGPVTGATEGPLSLNATKLVYLTHSGSLNARSCTAKATWEIF